MALHLLPPRQLLDIRPTTTSTSTAVSHMFPSQSCTPFTLPAGGHILIDATSTIQLPSNAVFTPECTGAVYDINHDGLTTIADMQDPFHASVTPQAFATGAATVISWMLVIMLLITPRTFFAGGASGTSGLMGRGGLISGAAGSASVIGVGSRPWLQKVAALTVAISLTIATADTFKVAEKQYYSGVMDAVMLRDAVVGSMEIKITRIVSDIFLWLAQVQTLIRLFPRHKEKVLIKWIGFALIVLDVTFSCLNTFKGNPVGRPKRFVDAIPALSYLFQLALSMLYAAWVLYYSITKHRYAFYHPLMWNISLVALVSIIAILTPVVFFITDISNASVAGWGDYFRWVGAAAASVIVWEWVERIEALEREEKKDGILGREVFDGDDMLNFTPAEQNSNERTTRTRSWHVNAITHRIQRAKRFGSHLRPTKPLIHENSQTPLYNEPKEEGETEKGTATDSTTGPIPPPQAATPISRSDTTSADSTVYTVRYHPISEPSPLPRRHSSPPRRASTRQRNRRTVNNPENMDIEKGAEEQVEVEETDTPTRSHRWDAVRNPFKRQKAEPPREVRGGTRIEPRNQSREYNHAKWDVKGRISTMAAEQGEKYREKKNRKHDDHDLPVTIIPAQPRGRTWSPEILQTSTPSNRGTERDSQIANHSPNSSEERTQPTPDSTVWRSISQRSMRNPQPSILTPTSQLQQGLLSTPSEVTPIGGPETVHTIDSALHTPSRLSSPSVDMNEPGSTRLSSMPQIRIQYTGTPPTVDEDSQVGVERAPSPRPPGSPSRPPAD
ncbi:PalH-domain-containing protein [Aulographum hederae CBS 113979]|uniref:PalH-domain-containing protein n=1 Tax=Aulographum hederae CBS 113979 TaxID=1176131 RepID=A0A6G1HA11_9PEZI|nr:PalH-domain-containing protein [Aulographum hederae CBS 113979]